MDIAKAAQRGDAAMEINGLKLYLEQRAHAMLVNTNIDFMEGRGFVLSGMKQDSCGSCSC